MGEALSPNQVVFFIRASYSYCIANFRLGSINVFFILVGLQWTRRREGWIQGWCIPNFDLVCIGWIFIGLGGQDAVSKEEDTWLGEA